MAGQALSSSLVRILDPASKYGKELQKLGIQAVDPLTGKFVGMASLLKQLESGTKNMTDAQRASYLQTVFGAEAFQEINILLAKGGDALATYTQKITNTNKAQEMADKMNQGFNASLKSLASAFEDMQISIAKSGLMDFAQAFVEQLTKLVRWVGTLNPTLLKWGTILAGVAAAIGPVLLAIGGIIAVIPTLVTGLKAVGVAVTFATGPIGIAITAFAALTAGVVYAYKNFKTFRQIVDGFVNVIISIPEILSRLDFKTMAISWITGAKIIGKGFADAFNEGVEKSIAKDKAAEEKLKMIAEGAKIADERLAKFAAETVTVNVDLKPPGGGGAAAKRIANFPPVQVPLTFSAPDIQSGIDKAMAGRPIQLPEIILPDLSTEGILEAAFNISDSFALMDEKAKLLGASYNATTEKINFLKAAMLQLVEQGLSATSPEVMALQAQVDTLTASVNPLADAFEKVGQQMAVSMADAAASVIAGSQSIRQAAGGIIKAFISQGVAAVIGNALKNSTFLGPVAIPIAAAAGKAASALFGRLVPAFANGGIVSGPTLAMVGEYPGARSNPEVIAPLNKLRGMIGGGAPQEVIVTGRIEGDAIRITNQKTAARRGLIS